MLACWQRGALPCVLRGTSATTDFCPSKDPGSSQGLLEEEGSLKSPLSRGHSEKTFLVNPEPLSLPSGVKLHHTQSRWRQQGPPLHKCNSLFPSVHSSRSPVHPRLPSLILPVLSLSMHSRIRQSKWPAEYWEPGLLQPTAKRTRLPLPDTPAAMEPSGMPATASTRPPMPARDNTCLLVAACVSVPSQTPPVPALPKPQAVGPGVGLRARGGLGPSIGMPTELSALVPSTQPRQCVIAESSNLILWGKRPSDRSAHLLPISPKRTRRGVRDFNGVPFDLNLPPAPEEEGKPSFRPPSLQPPKRIPGAPLVIYQSARVQQGHAIQLLGLPASSLVLEPPYSSEAPASAGSEGLRLGHGGPPQRVSVAVAEAPRVSTGGINESITHRAQCVRGPASEGPRGVVSEPHGVSLAAAGTQRRVESSANGRGQLWRFAAGGVHSRMEESSWNDGLQGERSSASGSLLSSSSTSYQALAMLARNLEVVSSTQCEKRRAALERHCIQQLVGLLAQEVILKGVATEQNSSLQNPSTASLGAFPGPRMSDQDPTPLRSEEHQVSEQLPTPPSSLPAVPYEASLAFPMRGFAVPQRTPTGHSEPPSAAPCNPFHPQGFPTFLSSRKRP